MNRSVALFVFMVSIFGDAFAGKNKFGRPVPPAEWGRLGISFMHGDTTAELTDETQSDDVSLMSDTTYCDSIDRPFKYEHLCRLDWMHYIMHDYADSDWEALETERDYLETDVPFDEDIAVDKLSDMVDALNSRGLIWYHKKIVKDARLCAQLEPGELYDAERDFEQYCDRTSFYDLPKECNLVFLFEHAHKRNIKLNPDLVAEMLQPIIDAYMYVYEEAGDWHLEWYNLREGKRIMRDVIVQLQRRIDIFALRNNCEVADDVMADDQDYALRKESWARAAKMCKAAKLKKREEVARKHSQDGCRNRLARKKLLADEMQQAGKECFSLSNEPAAELNKTEKKIVARLQGQVKENLVKKPYYPFGDPAVNKQKAEYSAWYKELHSSGYSGY